MFQVVHAAEALKVTLLPTVVLTDDGDTVGGVPKAIKGPLSPARTSALLAHLGRRPIWHNLGQETPFEIPFEDRPLIVMGFR
jgi:hypothetical protein